MDTSTVVVVLAVVCLVAVAIYRMNDVEAVFRLPLLSVSLKAKGKRYRRRANKVIE